jgi:hypothetical protein
MYCGVFYVAAELGAASNLEHFVATCLRRRDFVILERWILRLGYKIE